MFNKIIKQIGSIPLDSFIDLSLNEFYSKNNITGKQGHFITSPEISSLFGEIIAAFIVDYIFKNNINQARIVEIGGGNGKLITDIINTIFALGYADKIKEFIFIEKNRAMQTPQNTTRLQDINDIPTDIPIIIISNELLDALPIKQFVFKQNKWYEILVGLQNTDLCLMQSSEPAKIEFCGKENDILELPVFGMKLFEEMCHKISASFGTMLTIDYGFEKHKFGHTLQAIQNHKKVDFLQNAQSCDITHLVQFEFFEKIAKKYKLNTKISTQHDFLIQNGILTRCNDASTQRLIDINDGGMGNFLVMQNY